MTLLPPTTGTSEPGLAPEGTATPTARLAACRVVSSEISARILIAEQVRQLDEYEWTIVGGDEPQGRMPGERYVRIPMSREPAISDLRSFLSLMRWFRANRFAFVQTHTPKASLLGLPAARLAGQRTVYTMHGGLYFKGNGRIANLLGWVFERWCCSWADVVTMQSWEDTQVLPAVKVCAPRKVRYQGNGIVMERFPRRSDPGPAGRGELPVVVNISRLVVEKGCLDFFHAAEQLHGRARFVHVGPSENDQADAVDPVVIADLAQRGIVEFVGAVDDVHPWLEAADLFVLPSFREGIPRACIEAAATGLAVVAYDVRGVREVVPASRGLLAPRGDREALTAAIARLIDDRAALAEAAEACCTHARERFDERLVYNRLRTIYAEVTGA
jgi:glycosyltransferase involved in cell wall biosynthesis